jgi:hypothetical protein
MGIVDRLKRDLSKHRGKTAVLGVLFATMVAMSVRAALELGPRDTQAGVNPVSITDASDKTPGSGEVNAQDRIKEGQELWRRLQQVNARAAGVDAAFRFDTSFYPPLPAPVESARPVVPMAAPEVTEPVKAQAVSAGMVDAEAIRAAHIRQEASRLVIKSIVVGNANTPSMTIVNQQLLKVGQTVQGFEITAINEREVEVRKEGVITVIRTPDGQKSQ